MPSNRRLMLRYGLMIAIAYVGLWILAVMMDGPHFEPFEWHP